MVLKPKLTFGCSEELSRTTNVRALPPDLLLNRNRMESGHGCLRRSSGRPRDMPGQDALKPPLCAISIVTQLGRGQNDAGLEFF